LEILVAMAILALCLFPFLPSSSKTLLKEKKRVLPILLNTDFEEKICQIREELALKEKGWLEGFKEGQTLFSRLEPVQIDDFALKGQRRVQLRIKKIYGEGGGSLVYRLELKVRYSIKPFKQTYSLNFLMAYQP